MSVILSLEAKFCCGDSIEDITKEMCRVARGLHVIIESNINGVVLFAYPDSEPDKLHSEYLKRIKTEGE